MPRKTLGHLALHYRTKEEGPAAAKLLDLLGFARVPSPEGYPFYHYVVDGEATNNGDGILFIMEQPQALHELNEVIREALKVDQPGEHPMSPRCAPRMIPIRNTICILVFCSTLWRKSSEDPADSRGGDERSGLARTGEDHSESRATRHRGGRRADG